jgi:hypothetical protein
MFSKAVFFALVLTPTLITDSWARSCSDVTDGAREGPEVPAGTYSRAFTLPYSNACFVQWPGNNRGAAGRAADKEKCYSLDDVDILEYEPDGGSNFNLCGFRLKSESLPAKEPKSQPPRPAPPKSTSNATYTIRVCNNGGGGAAWIALLSYLVPDSQNPWQKAGGAFRKDSVSTR